MASFTDWIRHIYTDYLAKHRGWILHFSVSLNLSAFGWHLMENKFFLIIAVTGIGVLWEVANLIIRKQPISKADIVADMCGAGAGVFIYVNLLGM